MNLLPMPYSYNLETELSQENKLINSMRSRIAAIVMLLIALLGPIEAIAASCQTSGFTCRDATACKTLNGVQVCLAGVSPLPAGAMQTTKTCWDAVAVYNCAVQAMPMVDTCGTYKSNPKCGVINSTCIWPETTTSGIANPTNTAITSAGTASNPCTAYTDTYSCQTSGGEPTTYKSCGNQTFCTNGNCFQKKDAANNALGKVIAGLETTRQAGAYMDPATQRVFVGQPAHCNQSNLGFFNCCIGDSKGLNYANTVIVNELIKSGWNSWTKNVMGSSYTFDSLFDSSMPYVNQAISTMTEVANQWIGTGAQTSIAAAAATVGNNAGAAAGAGAATGTAGAGISGFSTGGVVGGALGSAAATALVGNQGRVGNAVVGSVGSAAGSFAGQYAVTYANYAGVAAYNSGSLLAGNSAGLAGANGMVSFCWVCLAASIVIAIITALVSCDEEEAKTKMKLGAGLCLHVGSYCHQSTGFGGCGSTRHKYCCYNSKLARIVNQQGKPLLGQSHGTARNPVCDGITANDLQALDFSKMDLSEFVSDVVTKATPDPAALQKEVKDRIASYYANTPPAIMNGSIPGPQAGTPQAVNVNIVGTPTPPPPLPACNVNLAKSIPDANGNINATFTIDSCFANGDLFFTYTGNCAPMQMAAPNDKVQVSLDANGGATYGLLMSASCLAATTPATFNAWDIIVKAQGQLSSSGRIPVGW